MTTATSSLRWTTSFLKLCFLVAFSTIVGSSDPQKISFVNTTVTLGFDIKLHYYGGTPENPIGSVLLLHGAAYSAQEWITTGTLKAIAEAGYKVIALDLPGHGLTRIKDPAHINHIPHPGDLINDVVDKLQLSNLAIVSPSMSGKYSLEFLMLNPKKIAAFIPVAPVIPEGFDVAKLSTSTSFFTLAIWGSKDTGGRDRSQTFLKLPGALPYEIEGATHPCYLDEPEIFNQIVIEFLSFVNVLQRGIPKPLAHLPS